MQPSTPAAFVIQLFFLCAHANLPTAKPEANFEHIIQPEVRRGNWNSPVYILSDVLNKDSAVGNVPENMKGLLMVLWHSHRYTIVITIGEANPCHLKAGLLEPNLSHSGKKLLTSQHGLSPAGRFVSRDNYLRLSVYAQPFASL
jgi:hypothetical protein